MLTLPPRSIKNGHNLASLGAVGCLKVCALAELDRKSIEKNLDVFCNTSIFNVLIASYECLRTHIGRLNKKVSERTSGNGSTTHIHY